MLSIYYLGKARYMVETLAAGRLIYYVVSALLLAFAALIALWLVKLRYHCLQILGRVALPLVKVGTSGFDPPA